MAVFRSDASRFVLYCFQTDIIKRQIQEHLGATINQITNKSLNSFKIPYPEAVERTAIIKALSDVDGLLSSLEALIAKKRAIKQAAVQQLLTGQTRLPGFHREWTEKLLVDLASITMGQSPPSASYNQSGVGLSLIQGKADLEDRRTVSRVWTTQATKRCERRDLVLTVRAPVGSVAIASSEGCLGRGVCGLKPYGDSRFLFHTLVHHERRWEVLEQGSTFTAANSKQVSQFRMFVPEEEAEQRAIAAVLSIWTLKSLHWSAATTKLELSNRA